MRFIWLTFALAFFGKVADSGNFQTDDGRGSRGPQIHGQKSEDKQNGITELQGNWEMLGGEEGGKKIPPDPEIEVKMVVVRDKMTYIYGDSFKDEVSFSLSENKTPKEIDLSFIDDDTKKSKKILGIYKLQGKSLTICFSRDDAKRPTDFLTKPDDNRYVHVFKLQK